jgi:hypothetical protein
MRSDEPEPVAAEPDGALTEDAPVLTEAPESATPDRARDESGKFAKETKKPTAKLAPVVEMKPKLAAAPAPAGKDGAAPVTTPPGSPAPLPSVARPAPLSWKPELKAKWGSLPEDVQAEITRREVQTTQALAKSDVGIKRAAQWDQTLAPFHGLIAASGGDPHKVVGPVLQAQAVLQYGSPQQKAGLLAGLITGYGVTVEDLATALDGKAAAPQAQPQMRDPRVDQLFASAQREKSRRDEEGARAAAEVWDTFAATHEHAEKLKSRVVALLQAGNQGKETMSLEEAYEAALYSMPDLRKVMAQREAAAAATAKSAATQAKVAAASSMKTVPGGAVDEDGPPGSLRGDLEFSLRRMKAK